MDLVGIVRTLVEHSTLNGTDKADLLGIIDAFGESAPAETAKDVQDTETPEGA